jgi:NAD+ synthase (glutamine-hydrolysing)
MVCLRLAAAQLDPVVGDLDGNVRRVLAALAAAEAAGADLCVFPELMVTGYPPEDLLLKPSFVSDNVAALEEIAAATGDCVAVVGFVDPAGAGWGDPRGHLANAAALCAGGRVRGIYHKRLLPNYGVFDEQRWFRPGTEPLVLYRISGAAVAVTVCEDLWFPDGPVPLLGRSGADLVVNINASPYSRGRREDRLALLRRRVAEAGCPIAYVNQVGGQDELVFDGASLVVGPDGTLLATGRQFEEDLVLVDLELAGTPARAADGAPVCAPVPAADQLSAAPLEEVVIRPVPIRSMPPLPSTSPVVPLDPVAEVYAALVLGTRDYLRKNGFTDAVLGLSGGIDSSLVAAVAADALGGDHVHALAMPSRYSSESSVTDARTLADRLGVALQLVPIETAHAAMAGMLTPVLGGEPQGLTDENLQSRLRGVLLMAVSNATGWIVLTTGNKSELATGYSTLYGDSAGGFAVIKDVPKTLVYELCRYRNAVARETGAEGPIPESVLAKPPSAELRPGQRDDQSLPPYDLLDPVLEAYVERDMTAPDLVAAGFDPALVDRVVRLVDQAEYKRRQSPPGVRVTTKAFGKDRRMPITNHYRPPPVGMRGQAGAPSPRPVAADRGEGTDGR